MENQPNTEAKLDGNTGVEPEASYRSELALMACFELVERYRSALPENVKQLLAEESEAANTQRAYRADLRNFLEWCRVGRRCPLPCDSGTLAEYLVVESLKRSLATVRRRAAAVGWLHRQAGFLGEHNPREDPLVRETLIALAKRHRGTQKQAKELGIELMRELVAECRRDSNELLGLRNRALVLVGFASGLRASNLTKIRVEEISIVLQGMEIKIPNSKTDQEGRGHTVRLARGQVPATCPVRALQDWMQFAGIGEGFVFRRVNRGGKIGSENGLTEKTVTRTIKGLLARAGVPEGGYSSHSLRSGFASTAAEKGASIQSIKTQGAWKSDGSLLRYIRNRDDWESAASCKLGL